MIGAAGVRICLATAAVDGRKGFDTLCAIVRQALGHDPLCGDLFVFRNRSTVRFRFFFRIPTAWFYTPKRLERGTFRWPQAGEASIALSGAQRMESLAGRETGFASAEVV